MKELLTKSKPEFEYDAYTQPPAELEKPSIRRRRESAELTFWDEIKIARQTRYIPSDEYLECASRFKYTAFFSTIIVMVMVGTAVSAKSIEVILRLLFDEATGFVVLQYILFGVISIFLISLSAMTYYLFKSIIIRQKEQAENGSSL